MDTYGLPVAEHSQWRRFWRLKELLEKTVASVPCRTMTLGTLPSHTELNKMESTMASHIATHEQFPSVHRDQVADKPLRLCLSHGHALLAAALRNVADGFPPGKAQPHVLEGLSYEFYTSSNAEQH